MLNEKQSHLSIQSLVLSTIPLWAALFKGICVIKTPHLIEVVFLVLNIFIKNAGFV
jgi:hypothetical protein